MPSLRVCAEYINFIAQTTGAPSLDPAGFMAQADANVDFAWVYHFLHNAVFFA